jgi:hypothetical protein
MQGKSERRSVYHDREYNRPIGTILRPTSVSPGESVGTIETKRRATQALAGYLCDSTVEFTPYGLWAIRRYEAHVVAAALMDLPMGDPAIMERFTEFLAVLRTTPGEINDTTRENQ